MSLERTPASPGEVQLLLTSLRESAAQAQSEDEVRAVISRIASITRTYRIQHGIGIPMDPASQAQELDSKYVIRPHIELLSDRLAQGVRDVERGKNRMIAVSMPPRSGKSMLVSLYSPLWMLRRHPEWKIVTASHDGSLTSGWARQIRHFIEDRPDLGIAIARDGGGGGAYSTLEGGGMFSTSVRGALTGRGARVLIIDDPVKDFVEAHSLAMRQNLWDWWLSVAQARLEPPYLVLVVMCMTGDTPVLLPNGTERPLKDTRPGDEIATYENGRLTTSRVLNWANQGPDEVFSVTMASGRVVRANARHPFLVVDQNGRESWRKVSELRPGNLVRSVENAPRRAATTFDSAEVCAAVTTPGIGSMVGESPIQLRGESGRTQRALSMVAISLSRPRDSALPTTTRTAGPRVSGDRPPKLSEKHTCETATGSTSKSMSGYLPSKEESAPSASDHRTSRTLAVWDASSLTTRTMTALTYADCSAMTATFSSGEEQPPISSSPRLSTCAATTDEVVSVVSTGYEDVFDIEVERTHNFIANHLCVSNTRWHEDDFVGRIFSDDYEGDSKQWEKISLPALADTADDPLQRTEGYPLMSPLLIETPEEAVERWNDVRRQVGTYTFAGMYQQRPAPARGAIFDAGWWRFWTMDQTRATEDGRVIYLDPSSLTGGRWIDSWDCNFESSEIQVGGWVVGQRWVRQGANRYLIAQQRKRWTFTQTILAMEQWAETDSPFRSPCGHLVHERLIEKRANGAAIINVLRERISGLKPINPTTSKEARARAVTPEIESGNVLLPHPGDPGNEWVTDFLSEVRNFPYDSADDQVDAMTQALSALRVGRGQITVPGRQQVGRQGWQISQDVARAAMSDLARRRG